jgi:Leucine-rich repeat (LRR) protein
MNRSIRKYLPTIYRGPISSKKVSFCHYKDYKFVLTIKDLYDISANTSKSASTNFQSASIKNFYDISSGIPKSSLIEFQQTSMIIINDYKFFDGKYPKGLQYFYNLTHLIITNCDIFDISNIKYNNKLVELNLPNNIIESIPIEISKLIELSIINLNNNRLKEIPKFFKYLTGLSILEMENNFIEIIPKELEKCKSLKVLKLSNNNIREVPYFITQLPNLEYLFLRDNKIEILPEKVASISENFNKILYNFFATAGLNQSNSSAIEGNYFDKLIDLNLNGTLVKSIPEGISSRKNLSLNGLFNPI